AQEETKPPTDAEIAAIAVTANRIDADMGEFAAERASNATVRAFATTMTRDHRAVIEQAAALVERLGVTPMEGAVTKDLDAGARTARERLAGISGAAFDRAYIEHEIAYHQAVIEAVDGLLLPNARHPELRKAIVDVR